jgi:hypothetical protein
MLPSLKVSKAQGSAAQELVHGVRKETFHIKKLVHDKVLQ